MFTQGLGSTLVGLTVVLCFVGLCVMGGFRWGRSETTISAQVRYDSLYKQYSECRSTVNTLKVQGAVAASFIQSYDQDIQELVNEKRALQSRFDSAVWAARRLTPRAAEAAVSRRYQQ